MKTYFVVAILVFITGLTLWSAFHREEVGKVACTKEARICSDGTAVGRSGPSCEFAPCPTTEESATSSPKLPIVVQSPLPGETIGSPLTMSGEALGSWFFEGTFPVTLVDWDGLIIAEGYAEAEGAWMTEDYVPFHARLFYTTKPSPYNRGTLILKKDNPSGLPEHDDAIEIPIFIGGTDAGMEYPDMDTETGVPPKDESVLCTMDAKICPDGSAVGRVAPSCEFTPCP